MPLLRRADTENLSKSATSAVLDGKKPKKLVSSLRRLLGALQGAQRSTGGNCSPAQASKGEPSTPEHAGISDLVEASGISTISVLKPAPRPMASTPQLALPPVDTNLSPTQTSCQLIPPLRSKAIAATLSPSPLQRVPTVNFSTGAISDRCTPLPNYSMNDVSNKTYFSISTTSNSRHTARCKSSAHSSANMRGSPLSGVRAQPTPCYGALGAIRPDSSPYMAQKTWSLPPEPTTAIFPGALEDMTNDGASPATQCPVVASVAAPPIAAPSASQTFDCMPVSVAAAANHVRRDVPDCTNGRASGGDNHHASRANASSSSSVSTLIAVCPGIPGAMRRPLWQLADYSITGRMYKGEVSSVYKAVCLRSNAKVALKVYSLDRVAENVLHTLVREIKIHTELTHRHILKMYSVFEEERRLVLVLERAARGDLLALYRGLPSGRMSEDQLRILVLVPLLDALVYLHARGICHRDIKPENLLMSSDWVLKVADFGAAINLAQERAVTRTGTVDYMAPEVERCPLKAAPEDNKDNPHLAYTTAADVWSLGVLAYELLVGFPPFIYCGNSDLDGTWARLAGGAPNTSAGPRELSFPHFVSAGAQDFIAGTLLERPGDRPTAAQLMRHPWLKYALRQYQMRQQQQQQQQQQQHQLQQQQQQQQARLSSSHLRLSLDESAALASSRMLNQAPAAAPSRGCIISGSGTGGGSSTMLAGVLQRV